MHIRIPFFIASLLICAVAFSNTNDSISVRGCFLMKEIQTNSCKGVLYQFKSKKQLLSFDIEKGNFDFKLPLPIEPGVYRLQYGEGLNHSYTDLIIDGKETEIRFELRFINDGDPIFLESSENQKWYNYLKDTHARTERLTSLFDYLSNFSDQVSGKQILKIYQKERRNYYKLFSDFVKNNTCTWAGLLVANKPYYFSDLKKKPVLRDFIRINYYWEDIDTTNPCLINSPIYIEHIDSYLNKIISQTVIDNALSKEYKLKSAIDLVIEKFSNNISTKKFAIECLKNYFVKPIDGMDNLKSYVAQKEFS